MRLKFFLNGSLLSCSTMNFSCSLMLEVIKSLCYDEEQTRLLASNAKMLIEMGFFVVEKASLASTLIKLLRFFFLERTH